MSCPKGCSRFPQYNTNRRVFSGTLCILKKRYKNPHGSLFDLRFVQRNFLSSLLSTSKYVLINLSSRFRTKVAANLKCCSLINQVKRTIITLWHAIVICMPDTVILIIWWLVLRARVRANLVWFELPSSYVSYMVVSAVTDLAGAILARAGSGGSHSGGSWFRREPLWREPFPAQRGSRLLYINILAHHCR